MASCVEMENVSFSYPQSSGKTLDGISLKIGQGEYVAVVGANGSGKSTLAKLLAGFIDPDDGTVSRPDDAVAGIVFQHPKEQIVAGTVGRDTAFGPRNLGLPDSEVELRVMECLSVVDLADRSFSRTVELSLGQAQRLSLAGILALFPNLLILDETTAMLDPDTRGEVLAFIDQWNRRGHGIVHVTHDKDEVRHASRVIVMSHGKMAFDGTSADFFRDDGLVLSVFGDDDALRGKKRALSGTEPVALSVEGLSFSYGGRHVLSRVSFALRKGSLVALTGPSGCGKSTLLECVAGILSPDEGEVRAASRPLLALQDSEAALFEQFAADDVAFGARTQGLSGKELRNRVRYAMDAAGIPFDDFADRETFRLSGGEQRKLSLAGIIALDGDVYLFDEPTAGLDPFARQSVLSLLRKLAEEGKTVLFSTHRMDEAGFADEVLPWDSLSRPQENQALPADGALGTIAPVGNASVLSGIRRAAAMFTAPPVIPDSPVGRLHPVLKYLVFLSLFSLSLCFRSVVPCLVLLALDVLYALLARYPLSKPLRALARLSPWLLLIAAVQMVFVPPLADEVRFVNARWFMVTPSKLLLCAVSLIRIVSCIICMGTFIFSTDETQVLDGLSGLLSPLALVHVPVRYAVLVVGIIFRFIPLLMEETESIIKTQIIRGAYGKAKGLGKIRRLVPLFAPLMIQTFRKAESFAAALTARCFS